MAKKVRIKDIAESLGLSSTLVSMVLNNKANMHGIKTETQERVIAKAHSMGYFETGNASEKSREDKYVPGIVGMIVTSLTDPFIVEIAEHLRKAFDSIGFGFSILTLDPYDNRYGKFTSSIKRMFSAVILTGDSSDDQLIRALKVSKYPFLLLEKSNVNLRTNEVISNCEEGAEKLILHLAGFNYKRYSIVRSPGKYPYLEDKVQCIKSSITQHIPDSEINECRVEIDITGNINDTDIAAMLNQPLSTDAIIVTEANLVYPLYESLMRLKTRIPGDIALVSMEKGHAFNLLPVPITYLKRDTAGMASKIVSMLWSEIKNSGKSKFKRTVSLSPTLVVGRSCGN